MTRSRTYIATPPGATIKEQLIDRGMSQKEFAFRMNMSEKHISRLINGDVQLTPDVALRLEIVLGIEAGFWTRLEAIYREKLARVEAENSLDEDEEIAKILPYSEMATFEWVPKTKDSKEKIAHLRRYFEVVTLASINNNSISRIACRRLALTQKSDLALLAWAQEARIKSREIATKSIDINALTNNIVSIRSMTTQSPDVFCPSLKALLSDCGVALVLLPHLKGSFLQGASFYEGNKIVLGLTTRDKDADKFWFSLFHELAHIVLGHLGKPDGTTENDELQADKWAQDYLIPEYEIKDFIDTHDYSSESIESFANKLGIAPGIVVGRLQIEKELKHNMLNDLKEQYVIEF